MVTRRELLAIGMAAQTQLGSGQAIRELNLPPELVSEIERESAGAFRQARLLEELPLDGVPPAFVFRP